MSKQDIRCEQRFSNYNKALNKLNESIQYIKHNFSEENNTRQQKNLNDLIKQGLIQSFEYTHELAWNVIKDYASYQGNVDITGSRDAARSAFSMGLISNGEVWMEMIQSRNKTLHTYNEETADEIFDKIINAYFPAFIAFRDKMESIRSSEQGKLFGK